MSAQLDVPATAPDWLADELGANPTFVQEAIENDASLTREMAWGYAARKPLDRARIERAVADWIAHQWEFHNADAVLISNVWQSFDREARK